MCDRVVPLDHLREGGEEQPQPAAKAKKLYIRIPGLEDSRWKKIRLVLTMFPGTEQLVVRCADTGKLLSTPCLIHPALVEELKELLGTDNVVVK